MKRIAIALSAGALFGLGLATSGMTNPDKVLNFLDVAGHWDPSLALVMGGALLVCAYGLFHVRSWGRSPVVVVQLIVFLTAWSFWGGDTRPVAVVLAVVSLATLVCLLHPRSIEALAGK